MSNDNYLFVVAFLVAATGRDYAALNSITLGQLVHLDLSNNRLKHLTRNWSTQMPALQYLKLSYNPLTLDSFADFNMFNQFPDLIHLFIVHYEICSIQKETTMCVSQSQQQDPFASCTDIISHGLYRYIMITYVVLCASLNFLSSIWQIVD